MTSHHDPSNSEAGDVAVQHRRVQREQDAKDRVADTKAKSKKPVQAGHVPEPENPMPAQHLKKPGLEAEMDLQPRFKASGYLGSGKLNGMVALVTGGDSGIGRAVALLYAREGADVAIVYLKDEQVDADETCRCVEAEGRHCVLIPGDVRDPEFCSRAVRETLEALGKLDILVNNYEGAIHAFTKSLASNLLHKGIRVNAVAPGPVWTPLNPADRPGEEVKDFGKDTDMKRPAQPEELAPAYVFLAAPCCASYITGIVLPITGSIGAV